MKSLKILFLALAASTCLLTSAEAAKPWPGFQDNGAAGVILERFPKK